MDKVSTEKKFTFLYRYILMKMYKEFLTSKVEKAGVDGGKKQFYREN